MDKETEKLLKELIQTTDSKEGKKEQSIDTEAPGSERGYTTQFASVAPPVSIELMRAGASVVKTRRSDAPINEMDFFQNEYEGRLTIDVYQDGDDMVVESTVAGVQSSDIDIAVTSESVTIRGERSRARDVKDDDVFYQECYWGKFSRSVILPQKVDPDHAQATLKNGVLTIRMPKLEEHEVKKLKVKEE